MSASVARAPQYRLEQRCVVLCCRLPAAVVRADTRTPPPARQCNTTSVLASTEGGRRREVVARGGRGARRALRLLLVMAAARARITSTARSGPRSCDYLRVRSRHVMLARMFGDGGGSGAALMLPPVSLSTTRDGVRVDFVLS
ncbi:hypothetical protein RR46_02152 [Papilio xuthus]|uniref:Uncharacterized protein n=1 Tax=Papilio xuthus TaxID=66420 RepID=A0A194QPV9_PAPXU|nr:hypothetical protein RR46_02152 [Papilio xuthus]